jgi:mutator protein MutT
MKHYEVTAAVIWHQGKVLVTSRPPGSPYAGLWEFPGGKREQGETLEACLLREIKEELGIDIAIKRYFMRVDHTYPEFSITLHVFLCTYQAGQIKPLPGVDYRWVSLDELYTLPFLPADEKIIERLKKDNFL